LDLCDGFDLIVHRIEYELLQDGAGNRTYKPPFVGIIVYLDGSLESDVAGK
jgi:hypothetical protein